MLSGVEVISLELVGRLPLRRAEALLPPGLAPHRVGDAAEVGLLCFRMRGLAPDFSRRLGLDYSEALWRIGVEWQGEAAWFGSCCDIDVASVRLGGRWLMRYPVRQAEIRISEDRVVVDRGGERLEVGVRSVEVGPDPIPPRPLLVSHRGRLYRVPWREDPAPERSVANVDVLSDSLVRTTWSSVDWQPSGLLHHGRGHHCGLAVRADR